MALSARRREQLEAFLRPDSGATDNERQVARGILDKNPVVEAKERVYVNPSAPSPQRRTWEDVDFRRYWRNVQRQAEEEKAYVASGTGGSSGVVQTPTYNDSWQSKGVTGQTSAWGTGGRFGGFGGNSGSAF